MPSMKRMGEGNAVLDRAQRDTILKSITEARAVAREVDQLVNALPAWALAPDSPLGEDRQRLVDAIKERNYNEGIVARLESRLATGGPIWNEMSVDEKKGLNAWIGALDVQAEIMAKYVPSETRRTVEQLALLGLSLAAFFGPLLWTEEEPPDRKPIPRVTPPSWLLPPPPFAPPPMPAAAARTVFRPTAAPPPPMMAPAIPRPPGGQFTPAEFMRIPVPMTPFQGTGPAAMAPGAGIQQVAPGVFRPAGASVAARPLGPIGPGPHTPVYPRYQRTT